MTIRSETAKVTNGGLYTAWAYSAYTIGDQIKFVCMERDIHTSGQGRIVSYTSDSNASAFSEGELLELGASGKTCWAAGYAGGYEYLIVRIPEGQNDVPPYTYQRWRRQITLGETADYNGAPWQKTNITFPAPPGCIGQPIMIMSFAAGHDGSIVLGASYTQGAAVMRSTDGCLTFTAHLLALDTQYEEPTVKWHAGTGLYVGFMRNSAGNPVYWASNDLLSTVSFWTAPAGKFGPNFMKSSPVPFDFKGDDIHAFSCYRSGTIEGLADDEPTSGFHFSAPVVFGNFWAQEVFRKNKAIFSHREAGGASAVIGGGVLVHDDQVHIFYGQEERQGYSDNLNRVSNIYKTTIFLGEEGDCLYDYRKSLAVDRSSGSLFRRIPGGYGYAIYLNDEFGYNPAIISGRSNHAKCPTPIILDGGVATLPKVRYGLYLLDTEDGAALNDLVKIISPCAVEGDEITLSIYTSNRRVNVKAGTDIVLSSDKLISNARNHLKLVYRNIGSSGVWCGIGENVIT